MTLALRPELEEIARLQADTQAMLAKGAEKIAATSESIESLKLSEGVGSSDSPKSKSETQHHLSLIEDTDQTPKTPPRIFLAFLMGMSLGLSLGAGVVVIAGLIFLH